MVRGRGVLLDGFGDQLLQSPEHQETTFLGPCGMVFIITLCPNEDDAG